MIYGKIKVVGAKAPEKAKPKFTTTSRRVEKKGADTKKTRTKREEQITE